VIEEVLLTDTIPLGAHAERTSQIKVLSVAPLLGEAIRRIHEDESVSSLFV
jgi:Phosphoribosylpyrophosphate synthetase